MTVEEVRNQILAEFPAMSPQLRRAAQYVLDNPNGVAVSSIRKLADAAKIKPNTLVRLARILGFAGFEEFRQPFRDSVTGAVDSFPDRARWLQALAKFNSHGQLYSQMAAASLANIEQLFSNTSTDQLRAVAKQIVKAPNTMIVGLGSCYALAYSFWYVGRMALDSLVLLPNHGSLPVDDVARISKEDVLIVISFNPYRSEVIQSVQLAKRQGATVVAITDSQASPIAFQADYVFVSPTRTPQFFPSTQAPSALLETLLAFIIGESDPKVIDRINAFHRRRQDMGAYREEPFLDS